MSCAHPVRAFKTGYKTDLGADEYIRCPGATTDILSYESAVRRKPVNLKEAPHAWIDGLLFLTDPVMQPCGKCIGCRLADAKEWKIRNCLEMTYERFCYFVTLTIDDEHLQPVTKENYKDMIQRFFKRWRKNVGRCRYFGCFEFGQHSFRPHFHVLFYAQIPDLKPSAANHFTSEKLVETWQQGNVDIELIAPGNVSYCCGYVEKKAKEFDNKSLPFLPFRFASRRPAIGFRYLEDHRSLFGSDPHVYGHFSDAPGRNHAPIPTSFKRKLKEEEYFTRLKIASEMAGINATEVSKVVYKLCDMPELEDAREQAMIQKIEKLRITKL